ncbi:MAG: PAS domain S-box protein, partial [Candidatus Altiarchaeota archaeon]|nr:PAS domain S-box protein [Candidatus Altiarchaeota archaeon]
MSGEKGINGCKSRGEFNKTQSFQHLEDIFNSIGDPLFIKDKNHRRVLVNDAYCRFIGRSRESLIGKSDYEIFSRDEADIFTANDNLVFDTGEEKVNEECYTSSDGVKHTIVTKKNLFVCADGEKYIVGIVRDVTLRKKLELDMVKTLDYLNNLINSIGDPIFVKDRQHRWVLLNDSLCKFMGYKLEELIGKSDYDFFPKSEADVFWAKDEEVFSSGKENLNEEFFTDANGVIHTILTKKTLYTDIEGNSYIVGTIRDVTLMKKYEAELRASKENLEKEVDNRTHDLVEALKEKAEVVNIINRSPVMVFLWRIAPGWPVEYASENVMQMGYTSKDFTSGKVSWVGITHPEDIPRLEEEVKNHLAKGQDTFRQTYRLKTKKGVYRWMEDDTRVLRDENGHPIHVQGLIIDVTELHTYQIELRRKSEELDDALRKAKNYLDIVGNIIVVLDKTGKVSLINKRGREILGYNLSDIVGKHWFRNFIPKDQSRQTFQVFKKIIAGEIQSFEHYRNAIVNREGEERIISWHNALLYDGDEIIGTISSGEDITEKLQAEQELSESEKKYRKLVEGAPIGVAVHSMGKIFYANREALRIIGAKKQSEIVGKSLMDFV